MNIERRPVSIREKVVIPPKLVDLTGVEVYYLARFDLISGVLIVGNGYVSQLYLGEIRGNKESALNFVVIEKTRQDRLRRISTTWRAAIFEGGSVKQMIVQLRDSGEEERYYRIIAGKTKVVAAKNLGEIIKKAARDFDQKARRPSRVIR